MSIKLNKTEFIKQANDNLLFADMWGTLCGNLIGYGASRDVYECAIMSDYVVKINKSEVLGGVNQNYQEWQTYHNLIGTKWAKYLAPVYFASHNYSIILQEKCEPIQLKQLPKRIPKFLNDRKLDNWGMLDGKVKCFDYGITNYDIPKELLVMEDWDCED